MLQLRLLIILTDKILSTKFEGSQEEEWLSVNKKMRKLLKNFSEQLSLLLFNLFLELSLPKLNVSVDVRFNLRKFAIRKCDNIHPEGFNEKAYESNFIFCNLHVLIKSLIERCHRDFIFFFKFQLLGRELQ